MRQDIATTPSSIWFRTTRIRRHKPQWPVNKPHSTSRLRRGPYLGRSKCKVYCSLIREDTVLIKVILLIWSNTWNLRRTSDVYVAYSWHSLRAHLRCIRSAGSMKIEVWHGTRPRNAWRHASRPYGLWCTKARTNPGFEVEVMCQCGELN